MAIYLGKVVKSGTGRISLFAFNGGWRVGKNAVQGIRWDGGKLIIPKSVLRVEALAWAVETHSTLEATWFAQRKNVSAQ